MVFLTLSNKHSPSSSKAVARTLLSLPAYLWCSGPSQPHTLGKMARVLTASLCGGAQRKRGVAQLWAEVSLTSPVLDDLLQNYLDRVVLFRVSVYLHLLC